MKLQYPKIGLRIVKTSIAVLLSILVFIVLVILDNIFNLDRTKQWNTFSNYYTPFFAGIAAAYALHNDKQLSMKQAKIRSLGSVFGGYFGMIILLIVEYIFLDKLNMNPLGAGTLLIEYLIIGAGIIPLIYLVVIFKKNEATFIACLTYLSVTISIRNGGMPVIQFATNRVLSTLIGVEISLVVNYFTFNFKRNKNILFVSSLDNALLNNNNELSGYLKYKLNNLLDSQANITFMTTRNLTSIHNLLQEIRIDLPIIVMNGSALYNMKTNEYESIKHIDHTSRLELDNLFLNNNINFFSFIINENKLYAYYNSLDDEGSFDYYSSRKKSATYSFVKAKVPDELDIAQYVMIIKESMIKRLIDDIKDISTYQNITLVTYKAEKEGYWYLKINSFDAKKSNSIKELTKKLDLTYVVCFGSGRTDLEVMKSSQLSFCLNNAPDYIKENADIILDSSSPEAIVKTMNRIYKTRNVQRFFEKSSK